VQVRADDLTSGFMPIDLRMFGMPGFDEFVENADDIENYVSMVSMFPLEVIISFLTRATTQAELEQIETYLDNPEMMLDQMAAQMGEPDEVEILTDAPQVGDRSTSVRVVLEMGDQKLEMEMIVFSREWVVVFAIDTHAVGMDPLVSVYDLAETLDERLQVALESN
jgi:hypothetical protein